MNDFGALLPDYGRHEAEAVLRDHGCSDSKYAF